MGSDFGASGKKKPQKREPKRAAKLCDHWFTKRENYGSQRGTWYRRGKKTKGRKRHIVVDTAGRLLAVVVHAANIHDTKSGILAAKQACQNYPTIQRFCADAGYRGTFIREIEEQLELGVDISEKIKPHEWEKMPWRWVVERTLSWLNHSRRLSKDFEITTSSEEAFVKISHFHNLLKRLWIHFLRKIHTKRRRTWFFQASQGKALIKQPERLFYLPSRCLYIFTWPLLLFQRSGSFYSAPICRWMQNFI